MKKIFILTLLLVISGCAFGQLNPVKNLTWYHAWTWPQNQYHLEWQSPDIAPGDTIIGYNVYRNNVLYRFQYGGSVYCMFPNCPDPDFLLLTAFWIKVTAVYNYNLQESEAVDSIYDYGISAEVCEKPFTVRILTNPLAVGMVLKMELPAGFTGGKVDLYSSTGARVRECEVAAGLHLAEMPTAGLPSGLYYVVAAAGGRTASQRLILHP